MPCLRSVRPLTVLTALAMACLLIGCQSSRTEDPDAHSHGQTDRHVHASEDAHTHNTTEPHDHAHEEGHSHGSDDGHGQPEVAAHESEISLAIAQQIRLGVKAAVVERETFSQQVRVAATVQAPPDRRVVQTTPISGHLAAAAGRSFPTLGDQVAAGDILAVIHAPLSGDAADLADAGTALVRTRQDLQLAQAELERAESLVAAGAAPTRRVEEAQAQVAASQAAYSAAKALLAGDGQGPELILRAPIAGTIVDISAGGGKYIESGGTVLTILDPTYVWIRGWIPEAKLQQLAPTPKASIDIPGNDDVSGLPIGVPVFLSPEMDPNSRTTSVVYGVDNSTGQLRVGQCVDLRLETRYVADALVVPNSALVDEHGRPVVFVQVCEESFVKRNVTIGGDDGRRSEILSGLHAGEKVVVEAAWAVKLAAAGTSAPAHGHTH